MSTGLGLNGALSMGAQALANAQAGVTVTGNNISNLNTKGAARQRVNYTSDISLKLNNNSLEGTGSVVSSIQGLRSALLDASVVQQSSLNGYYDTLESQTTLVQSALGESLSTSTSNSVATSVGTQQALTNFFDAWQSLSTSPTDSSARQEVLSTAQILAGDLNTTTSNLTAQQANLQTDAQSLTTSINGIAANIAQLNAQITRAEASGGTANDLRDQRQLQLENLAGLVDINVSTATNGMVNVTLSSDTSVALVNGATAGATATTATLGVDSTSPPLQITYSTSTVTNQAVANTDQMTGQLGADVYTVNVVIGTHDSGGVVGSGTGLFGKLDDLALNLATKVNALQTTGYDNTGTLATGHPFFNTGTTGAGNISVAITDPNQIAASNSSGTLDGSNATALANLRTDSTILPAYQNIVTSVGQQVSQTTQQAATQKLLSSSISTQRNSVSGISLDEETSNLALYQRSYEASSRFINTIDEMLKTIITTMGA